MDVSVTGLASLGASRGVSFIRPGSGLRWIGPSATSASSWVRLYAAEPKPRSAVCLNHVGSFAPSESAICCRDTSLSFGGEDKGDLAALFSEASMDSGRLREVEVGRLCCQESVFDLDGIAALGDALEGLLGLST